MIKKYILLVMLLLAVNKCTNSQVKSNNSLWKWSTWAVLQAIPSPSFFEDRNDSNSGLKFGLEWQLIPFSYSFNSNKYVSKLNFFYIKPSKRFSGSAEIFFEPSYITGSFKYSELKKFMYKTGARIVLPIAHKGEYFAFSMGGGYYFQETVSGKVVDGATYEAGIYTLYGMMGLKFNYNQKANSRYNIGIYFKYF
jgi:hypothetical protein